MQFTFSSKFWAFRPNYLSDLHESWQIDLGVDVKDYKQPIPSVGWLVDWSVGMNFTFKCKFRAFYKESRHIYIWDDVK